MAIILGIIGDTVSHLKPEVGILNISTSWLDILLYCAVEGHIVNFEFKIQNLDYDMTNGASSGGL